MSSGSVWLVCLGSAHRWACLTFIVFIQARHTAVPRSGERPMRLMMSSRDSTTMVLPCGFQIGAQRSACSFGSGGRHRH